MSKCGVTVYFSSRPADLYTQPSERNRAETAAWSASVITKDDSNDKNLWLETGLAIMRLCCCVATGTTSIAGTAPEGLWRPVQCAGCAQEDEVPRWAGVE